MAVNRGSTARVNAPRQARSRATMERILATTEELLADKAFEDITIAEISRRSGSAPTAIYARFSDKTALLLEVHERFARRAGDTIEMVFRADRESDLHTEEFIESAVETWTALYRGNRNLLRSVLLSGHPVVYARAAELVKQISRALARRRRISGTGSRTLSADAGDPDDRDLDFALRTALAILEQGLIYDAESPTLHDYDGDEINRRLTQLIVEAYNKRT